MRNREREAQFIKQEGIMYVVVYRQYGDYCVSSPFALIDDVREHIKSYLTTRVFEHQGQILSKEDKSYITEIQIHEIRLIDGFDP